MDRSIGPSGGSRGKASDNDRESREEAVRALVRMEAEYCDLITRPGSMARDRQANLALLGS